VGMDEVMEQVCHGDPSGTALVWRWLVGEG
jgi:hypothetical protein